MDRDFFSLPQHPDQIWGPQKPPIQTILGTFLGAKQPQYELDHSRPTSAEV